MGVAHVKRRLDEKYFAFLDFESLNDSERLISNRVTEQQLSFFGAARLAHEPEVMRFGIFKRIFTRYKDNDKRVTNKYKEWSERSPIENFSAALELDVLTQPEVEELVVARDPALIAISALEKVRVSQYPGISIEETIDPKSTSRFKSIYQAYELVLTSIHKY